MALAVLPRPYSLTSAKDPTIALPTLRRFFFPRTRRLARFSFKRGDVKALKKYIWNIKIGVQMKKKGKIGHC
jgi:hypothetical protein